MRYFAGAYRIDWVRYPAKVVVPGVISAIFVMVLSASQSCGDIPEFGNQHACQTTCSVFGVEGSVVVTYITIAVSGSMGATPKVLKNRALVAVLPKRIDAVLFLAKAPPHLLIEVFVPCLLNPELSLPLDPRHCAILIRLL